MGEPLLKIGNIPPNPVAFKTLLQERGYFKSDIDLARDVKFDSGKSYSLNNDTFLLYRDELERFKCILCVKVSYKTGLLVGEEVYILDTAKLLDKLSKDESIVEKVIGANNVVKYKIPATNLYFDVFMPSFVDKDSSKITSFRTDTTITIPKEYDFIEPEHYKSSGIETIDKMLAIYGVEKVKVFCELTIFKYRDRLGKKPGEDILREYNKIKWYENKIKELEG